MDAHLPPIDFSTPTGDKMALVRKGIGGKRRPLLDERRAFRRLAEQVRRVRDHQKFLEGDPHASWMEVAAMYDLLDALFAKEPT